MNISNHKQTRNNTITSKDEQQSSRYNFFKRKRTSPGYVQPVIDSRNSGIKKIDNEKMVAEGAKNIYDNYYSSLSNNPHTVNDIRPSVEYNPLRITYDMKLEDEIKLAEGMVNENHIDVYNRIRYEYNNQISTDRRLRNFNNRKQLLGVGKEKRARTTSHKSRDGDKKISGGEDEKNSGSRASANLRKGTGVGSQDKSFESSETVSKNSLYTRFRGHSEGKKPFPNLTTVGKRSRQGDIIRDSPPYTRQENSNLSVGVSNITKSGSKFKSISQNIGDSYSINIEGERSESRKKKEIKSRGENLKNKESLVANHPLYKKVKHLLKVEGNETHEMISGKLEKEIKEGLIKLGTVSLFREMVKMDHHKKVTVHLVGKEYDMSGQSVNSLITERIGDSHEVEQILENTLKRKVEDESESDDFIERYLKEQEAMLLKKKQATDQHADLISKSGADFESKEEGEEEERSEYGLFDQVVEQKKGGDMDGVIEKKSVLNFQFSLPVYEEEDDMNGDNSSSIADNN